MKHSFLYSLATLAALTCLSQALKSDALLQDHPAYHYEIFPNKTAIPVIGILTSPKTDWQKSKSYFDPYTSFMADAYVRWVEA